MAVDEGSVGQPGRDGQQADAQPDPIAHAELPQDEQQQRRDPKLQHECEGRQVPHGPKQDELQRARLEHRIGEGVRPAAGEQQFATVHEVDEVSRVRRSIEGCHRRGSPQDG